MSGKTLLKISSRAAEQRSTAEHERFKYLIAQIDKTRKARLDSEAAILEFRRADAQKLQPLRDSLRASTRETVFALDRIIGQQKWSRVDRADLSRMLCGTAELLLEGDPTDVEVKALYDRHSKISFDAARQEELMELKEHAEEYMGLDLGDENIRSEEDLVQRMYEQMDAKQREEGARQNAQSRARKKSSAQQRVEAGAQAAKQLLRDIHRKLASAVHPDREADEQRRVEKTELMQKINRAYATNDLLTLLEAQMRLEQIDSDRIGRLSADRLKQFNRLLVQQLEQAKLDLAKLEESFRLDHALEYRKKLTRENLTLVIQKKARELRGHVSRQKRFLTVLADKTSMKRWLREQRRFPLDWSDDQSED